MSSPYICLSDSRRNAPPILSNLTDQNKLTYTSQPDADLGDIVLDANENQLLLFGDDGTYTITCTQFPQEHFTVVVLDSGVDSGQGTNACLAQDVLRRVHPLQNVLHQT